VLSLTRRRRQDAAARQTPDPFDRRGYRRSPVTYASYRLGKEPPNKGLKFPPEVLTPEEIFRLMAACERRGRVAALHNRAMIAIGARSGLRCAEMLALYPKDVDLERGRVAVLHGKGDKARVVALDTGACAIVRQWADQRAKLGFDGRHALFCVVQGPTAGKPVQAPYVRQLVKDLASAAGIEKRVHYHGLRHSYASYLLDKGVPIHFIKRMLGHSSIAITEHYADHISPSKVIEMLHQLEWPSIEPIPESCLNPA
jgi:site-specific recombinase XerD